MTHLVVQPLAQMRRLRNQWTLSEAVAAASAFTDSVSAFSVCVDGGSDDGVGVDVGDVDGNGQ